MVCLLAGIATVVVVVYSLLLKRNCVHRKVKGLIILKQKKLFNFTVLCPESYWKVAVSSIDHVSLNYLNVWNLLSYWYKGMVEGSRILLCVAVSLGEKFWTFRLFLVSLSLESGSSNLINWPWRYKHYHISKRLKLLTQRHFVKCERLGFSE
jgi:hypothetical protein